jgi:hypothetical protein
MTREKLLAIAYEAVRTLGLPMDQGSVEANLEAVFCPACCEIRCDEICPWYVVPIIVEAIEKGWQ